MEQKKREPRTPETDLLTIGLSHEGHVHPPPFRRLFNWHRSVVKPQLPRDLCSRHPRLALGRNFICFKYPKCPEILHIHS